MKIAADGLPIFEDVQCWNCHGEGTLQKYEPCPNAGQTFRKGCPICGKTRKAEHTYRPKPQRETCDTCNGVGIRRENRFDSDRTNFWHTLPFKVFRSNRRQLMAEYLLGMGLCSVTDYGRHAKMTDNDLIGAAKSIGTVQYTKYVSEAGKVASFIGVFCNDNGYTIQAVWE